MVILFFTLSVFFKAGPRNFVRLIIKNPIILYCLLFSLLFALFVGATTQNFGTLCRYKIQCIPFYIIAIFFIQDYWLKYYKKGPVINGAV
jgi:hypothetical protein